MNPPPDPAAYHAYSAEGDTLQQQVTTLMARWQQAGVAPFEIAMLVATTACQALGHAVGHIPPPEGPELLQQLGHHLQHEAETCYFAHWQGSSS